MRPNATGPVVPQKLSVSAVAFQCFYDVHAIAEGLEEHGGRHLQ